MMAPIDLKHLRDRLSDCLFRQVIPFWLEHAVDRDGGLNTCLTDEGRLVSRDKWLWSQWRAVWVFSRLYRQTKDGRYLELAEHIVKFCCAYGWNGAAWRLCVAADGTPLREADSIYVDGFALYGLAEYARATDDCDARQWLRRTVTMVIQRLKQPHDGIPHFPYPVPPGMRVHGIPMIFSLCFLEAADQLPDEDCLQIARSLSNEIFSVFLRVDRGLILERVGVDGSEAPAPLGTTVVPGHAIESMWFQIHIANALSDQNRIDQSVNLIRRHLEIGWDDNYGGLLLAVDADGAADVGWKFSDYKLWWPHTEAMYALLRAYEVSGETWCLDWYAKVESYSLSHFPHPTAGEWVQRLRRNGEPTADEVALPVKDPFHLPRSLLLSLECIDRMQA
jgi:N-acylglucosamine 2-epimerase